MEADNKMKQKPTQFAATDALRQDTDVLADVPNGWPNLILIASGSNVWLIVVSRRKLQDHNAPARVVSMSSWDLFDAQPQSYCDPALLSSVRVRLAVAARSSQGWHHYVGDRRGVLAIERFDA